MTWYSNRDLGVGRYQAKVIAPHSTMIRAIPGKSHEDKVKPEGPGPLKLQLRRPFDPQTLPQYPTLHSSEPYLKYLALHSTRPSSTR
eukprot:1506463-Rhodomonas_salina.2